jgi:predicted kinase
MTTLYLIRGLPGSGKSTLANSLHHFGAVGYVVEADMYFTDDFGTYRFDPSRLHEAHTWCKKHVEQCMKYKQSVAVSNTFTTEKELQPYLDLAKEYGYTVISLIVENRHGSSSVHSVPEETIQKMKNRFSVKL